MSANINTVDLRENSSLYQNCAQFFRSLGADSNSIGFDPEVAEVSTATERLEESLSFFNTVKDDLLELENTFDQHIIEWFEPDSIETMMISEILRSPACMKNREIVASIIDEVAPVLVRLGEKFYGQQGQRVFYFRSLGIEAFRPSGDQVNEKLSAIFDLALRIQFQFESISHSVRRIRTLALGAVDSRNAFGRELSLIRQEANQMQEIIYEMDNRLARIADRPPQIEAPISSSEEPVSAAANQGFFQSVCSWFSGIFASFYNCLFGSFRSSEG